MCCSLTKLNAEAIEAALKSAPGWSLEDGTLRRDFVFADFAKALAFVNRVGAMAEEANHHPDIDMRYNRVRVSLVTHDAGGITASDTEMMLRLCRECGVSMESHTQGRP